MKQKEAGANHGCASQSVYGESSYLAPTGQGNVGHVAERNDGQCEENGTDCPVVRGHQQNQHGQPRGDVANTLEPQPRECVAIECRWLQPETSKDPFWR